jgi:hypothetical protein
MRKKKKTNLRPFNLWTRHWSQQSLRSRCILVNLLLELSCNPLPSLHMRVLLTVCHCDPSSMQPMLGVYNCGQRRHEMIDRCCDLMIYLYGISVLREKYYTLIRTKNLFQKKKCYKRTGKRRSRTESKKLKLPGRLATT